MSFMATSFMLRGVNIESDRATNTMSTLMALTARIQSMAAALDTPTIMNVQMYKLIFVDISRLQNIRDAKTIV